MHAGAFLVAKICAELLEGGLKDLIFLVESVLGAAGDVETGHLLVLREGAEEIQKVVTSI